MTAQQKSVGASRKKTDLEMNEGSHEEAVEEIMQAGDQLIL
jgi:hypothetical protein